MKDNVHNQNYLNEFGVICCNNNKMIEVKARVLNSPNVYYRNNIMPRIDNGKWRMANNLKLYNTKQLQKWMVVWIVDMKTEEDFIYYKSKLLNGIKNVFPSNGLETHCPKFLYLPNKSIPEVFVSIRQECGQFNPELVMFVFNESIERDEIKKLAENDKTYGYMTQCIKFDKFLTQIDENIKLDQPDWKLNNYLSNLLLKVNAKLGGCNNLVDYSILQKYVNKRVLNLFFIFLLTELS